MSKGIRPRLPKEQYNEYVLLLCDRVSIKEIIHEIVPLTKSKKFSRSELRAGKEWIALCPFHTERTPSFTVTEVKQFFHCFGCGAHGNVLTFLIRYTGWEANQAVQYLARRAHYWPSQYARDMKKVMESK